MPDGSNPFLDMWTIVGGGALIVVLLAITVTRGWERFYLRFRYDRSRHVRQHEREMARKARRWQREVAKLHAKARQSKAAH